MRENGLESFSMWYIPIKRYVDKTKQTTYYEFENNVVTVFNLFASIENIDFSALEEKINLISSTLPSIKRIFAKPIIHLVENDELLPVEAVRTINNKTVQYSASHSETWANLVKGGIKPKSLLSKNYVDNYSIYENIVFARCVDYILDFTRRAGHLLKDLITTNKKLEFNLFEKENHLSYFLALGKLHTCYVRSFLKYSSLAQRCITKLDVIENVITARLNRPVYKKNSKFKGKLNLHKTNILSMQKDYRKTYSFMKRFYVENDKTEEPSKEVKDSYFYFLEMLTIFAITHFNFQQDGDEVINLKKIDSVFSFKSYGVKIKRVSANKNLHLELTFFKDKTYKILLSPFELVENYDCDENILISPTENGEGVFVSINNIDSFRRLQQIILRGMIYSDEKRDVCPFCGEKLKRKRDGDHVCDYCGTVIHSVKCPETSKTFHTVRIFGYKNEFTDKIAEIKDGWSKNRLTESQLHFRNITALTSKGEEICPYCNCVHER